MRCWAALALVCLASQTVQAQSLPIPDPQNPRIHNVQWADGELIVLPVNPDVALTVMLEQGEQIRRVTLAQGGLLDVRVSPGDSSFVVLPAEGFVSTAMNVETDRRTYPMLIRTDDGEHAALIVQYGFGMEEDLPTTLGSEPGPGALWSYRMRGDREVRPATIHDDALRTFIEYGSGQSLPAVFAIGPTGEEEVVNGHMRGGVFVIDRVHRELVFRINDEKATARRNNEPDGEL